MYGIYGNAVFTWCVLVAVYRLKAQRWVLSRVPAQLKRWAAALRGLGANTTAAPLFVWSALRHARRCRERAGTTDAAFAPLEVAQLRSTVAEATTPLLDALARFGDVGIQGMRTRKRGDVGVHSGEERIVR